MRSSTLHGLLRTRLGLKLVLAVFASIVITEAVVLVPSYRNYEADLLTRLALIGRASLVSAYQSHPSAYSLLTGHDETLKRSEVPAAAADSLLSGPPS